VQDFHARPIILTARGFAEVDEFDQWNGHAPSPIFARISCLGESHDLAGFTQTHICGKLTARSFKQETVAMSRLTIDVTEQQHQALKALAALEGKTIRQYTLERLFPAAPAGEEEALRELRTLLVGRLDEARRGELAQGGMIEIAEAVLHGEPE
jgi:hypothetical protein